MSTDNRDDLCVNTIRFLAVDAVQQAKSGHPGAPMGAAATAYALWDRILEHNPSDPKWPDRDRFVLSPGHASALLYALLHLTGYDLPMDELRRFRQLESMTPGHPEYGMTPGVEMTTGPLGQGFAHSVGMAMAERMLAERFNRPGFDVVDHRTYAMVSDGDLQEGVASEAASLAGTLRLGRLICLYDSNDISIEGSIDITFTEDVAARFRAYDWQVIGPIDGMDVDAVESAIRAAREETSRPSLVICRTIIGYGNPNKEGTASAHGDPLGEDEVRLAKERLAWPYPDPFTVPTEASDHLREALARGEKSQTAWDALVARYRTQYPDDAEQLDEALAGSLPEGWDQELDSLFAAGDNPVSTRDASNRIMNAIAANVPTLAGGAADLAPSNRTLLTDEKHFGPDEYGGRNFHFGVREHAMGAVANGMALHGGVIPYTGTFLIFSDYMRPPMRLAALMGQRVVYVFSHDSVALGEDGPTHQPIEQLMGLRTVPNLAVFRPADATENSEGWRVALQRTEGPTALVLSRQNLPIIDRNAHAPSADTRKGGYVLWQSSDEPDCILIGTGSEVHIALDAGKLLQAGGISARVVSMPSWEVFDAQPDEYRAAILPHNVRARVSVEAGTTIGWERYVGIDGEAAGVDHFGASAPANVLYEKFGLTPVRVADVAKQVIARLRGA